MNKKIIPIIGGLIIIIFLTILNIIENKNDKSFIKNSINKKVFRIHNEQNKFFRYYFNNKKHLTSYHIIPEFELMIGDSISKNENTKNFKVYRMNSLGKYILIGKFEYNPDYLPWSNNKK